MNMHVPITDASETSMTSEGLVLIPEAIRNRVGLVPGALVEIGLNDRGEAVVRPAEQRDETPEGRRRRLRAAIADLARRYGTGQSTEDYMAEIRGPYTAE